MRIKDIIQSIEQLAPVPLQEDYDNSGIQVGDVNREATGAILAIDVTENVIDEAISLGCNLIISHHPMIFRPFKSLIGRNYIERCILKAIKNDTYLILIGDVDQLPPVGAGNCLSDIIKSSRFEVCRLKKIFRQAQESLIVVNAHKINDRIMPILDVKDSDFFFIKRESAEDIKELVIDLAARRLPRKYKVDFLDDIQIITPTRKGELGTNELNKVLQSALNPQDGKKKEKKFGSIIFREGDKIMQIKNNYDLEWSALSESDSGNDEENKGRGIFNGDIGRILSINTQSETMVIDFDKRITEYDFALLEELVHAYAITVHKSQGSEYKIVMMPAFDSPAPLMTKNLLYTAVTRAKEMVCIIGRARCIETMVKNDRRPVRHTALGEFLCSI